MRELWFWIAIGFGTLSIGALLAGLSWLYGAF
jgi:hypothetical protein